jgi:hypothetical protein
MVRFQTESALGQSYCRNLALPWQSADGLQSDKLPLWLAACGCWLQRLEDPSQVV